jgi:hypothetical protein
MKVKQILWTPPDNRSNRIWSVDRAGVRRVETAVTDDDGAEFLIMLCDCLNSFDIIIEDPDHGRECIWSLVRERRGR